MSNCLQAEHEGAKIFQACPVPDARHRGRPRLRPIAYGLPGSPSVAGHGHYCVPCGFVLPNGMNRREIDHVKNPMAADIRQARAMQSLNVPCCPGSLALASRHHFRTTRRSAPRGRSTTSGNSCDRVRSLPQLAFPPWASLSSGGQ